MIEITRVPDMPDFQNEWHCDDCGRNLGYTDFDVRWKDFGDYHHERHFAIKCFCGHWYFVDYNVPDEAKQRIRNRTMVESFQAWRRRRRGY